MTFKVIDRKTGERIEADDYAERYWAEQRAQEKDHPNENRLPYLFFKKCSWLIDEEGSLSIGDSCGNFVDMDYNLYEAVAT